MTNKSTKNDKKWQNDRVFKQMTKIEEEIILAREGNH